MIAATGFHTSDLVLLVVIVVLLCGSGFLALAETSLVRTSKVRAHSLREGGVKGSRRLEQLVERPPGVPQPGPA